MQKASGDYDTCGDIECNMWSREQFASHLRAERGDDDGAAAAAAVDAAIRDHVTVAMRSVADVAEARLGRVSDRKQRRTAQHLTPLRPPCRRAPRRLSSSASTF